MAAARNLKDRDVKKLKGQSTWLSFDESLDSVSRHVSRDLSKRFVSRRGSYVREKTRRYTVGCRSGAERAASVRGSENVWSRCTIAQRVQNIKSRFYGYCPPVRTFFPPPTSRPCCRVFFSLFLWNVDREVRVPASTVAASGRKTNSLLIKIPSRRAVTFSTSYLRGRLGISVDFTGAPCCSARFPQTLPSLYNSRLGNRRRIH